jgi:hypothetical protein
MKDHTGDGGGSHGPARMSRTLDDALRMIAVLSLYCSRASLELEIDEEWEQAPAPRKKSVRKAAILARQEEYWTNQESYKQAVAALGEPVSPHLNRPMRDLLGTWCMEDFDVLGSCQEGLGTLLWAIGAIDALPAMSLGFEPQITADAIASINAGGCAPAMRDHDAISRLANEMHVIELRDAESFAATRGRLQADGPERSPEECQDDARAKTLSFAASMNFPVQDGDIVIDGATLASRSEDEQQSIVLNAMARAQALRWLLGEAEWSV